MSGQSDTLEFETKKHYANDVMVRIPSMKNLIDTIGPYQFQTVDQSLKICLEKMKNDI